MDAKSFFILTRDVRNLQKEYFKSRDKEVLIICKEKEKELDAEIERVTKLGY